MADRAHRWLGEQAAEFVAKKSVRVSGTSSRSASRQPVIPDGSWAGRVLNERLREIDALYKLGRDRGGKDTG